MNPAAVYRKTAKGQDAMASRQSMSPKMRSVMIMVDGKRTGAELHRVAAALGDANEILAQLEAEGYLEPAGGAPQAPAGVAAPAGAAVLPASPGGQATPAPAPAAAPAPAVPRSLTEAQRFAVRFLNDKLGPMAESLCIRIESARNLLDLQNAVIRARDVVREVKGAALAEQFFTQTQARMPLA